MLLPLFLTAILVLTCSDMSGQQEPPTGIVTGHVYCADTQTPCRFASVVIQTVAPENSKPGSAAQEMRAYSAATDIAGSFELNGVTPGEYYILARLPGYVSPYDLLASQLMGDSHIPSKDLDGVLARVTVTQGKTAVSNLTLSRGASISGTVHYDDGGLAINVPVLLYRKDDMGKWQPYMNRAGDSDLAPLGFNPHTDDRGRFYEPALPPGMYIVEATLPNSALTPASIFGRQSLNVKITQGDALAVYSGNKYRMTEAVPLELHDNETLSDADITFLTVGLRSIHGSVIAADTGKLVSDGRVRLLDSGDKSLVREADIQNGLFQFNYVVDGSYILELTPPSAASGSKPSHSYAPVATQLLVQSDLPDLRYSFPVAGK